MRPSRASSLPPFVDEELVAFLLFFSKLHVYMDVSLYACLTGRTPYGTADGTRQFTVSWRGKQCLHCDFFHPSAELGLLMDVVVYTLGV